MDERLTNNGISENTGFTDIVEVLYITPENSSFSLSENNFLKLISDIDVKFDRSLDEPGPRMGGDFSPEGNKRGLDGSLSESNGASTAGGFSGRRRHLGMDEKGKSKRENLREAEVKYTEDGKRDYGRVFLHRAFPFDNPEKIISVQDIENHEIGIISDIEIFDEKTKEMLRSELYHKYFSPKIQKIIAIKERFGYLYWTVETNCGRTDFVLRDPFRSLIKINEDRIYLLDVDGNRFEIPSVSQLDRKSYRKIELYL